MSDRKGLFAALYRNEVEKLLAHRGRMLLVAFLVIVVGGSLLMLHGQASQRHMMAVNLRSAERQVRADRQQLKMATGRAKSAVEQQLTSDEKTLQEMKQQVQPTNEVVQLKQLKAGLKSIPVADRGSTLEQIATTQYMVGHGLTRYNPRTETAFRLDGQVLGGITLLVFALLAVGIGGDRVSQELEGGTWGVLLLHAPARRKIYLAKLSASLSILWGFIVSSALGFFVLGSLFFGIGSPMVPHVVGLHLGFQPGTVPPQLTVLGSKFHILPQWQYDLAALGLAMLALGVLTSIAVGLSMAFGSTIFAFIVGAVLVISGLFAEHAGAWAVIDPTTHLVLMEDWTGALAFQTGIPWLSLGTGLAVVGAWALASVAFGILWSRRLDV
ncbi:ABC transporter permease subunit [Sulfobacillus harzensis]|uniref:ABC transporter permease subunit n=1 Tax=Sulfobacillus harzensis TaxID=2729629 RepID=A0A7Y0L095_9FIRM|nr:ABC transporter permease subunit [Sulfobacillus harzensis]NMP20892.1 ABC transporter permease subunit [Sulfobacillus harzensis]